MTRPCSLLACRTDPAHEPDHAIIACAGGKYRVAMGRADVRDGCLEPPLGSVVGSARIQIFESIDAVSHPQVPPRAPLPRVSDRNGLGQASPAGAGVAAGVVSEGDVEPKPPPPHLAVAVAVARLATRRPAKDSNRTVQGRVATRVESTELSNGALTPP